MSPPVHGFDLWSPEARIDPLSLYARMRQEAPIARILSPTQRTHLWIVSRY